MFQTRLIREDDAMLQIEALAWMIRSFGPPKRPVVPSPLHKSPQLNDIRLDEMDTRSVYVWAEDMFAEIVAACDMGSYNPQLCALTGVPDEDPQQAEMIQQTGSPFPLVYYDPSRCEDQGFFPAITIMQLSEIRCSAFMPEAGLSPLMQGMLLLAGGAYMGQGFALANLVPDVSTYLTTENDTKPVPYRLVENILCFATCLNLMVKRQSPEQIVATYGTIMPKSFRRKIRIACKQIASMDQELKLLQVLAEAKGRTEEEVAWGPRYEVAQTA